MVQRLIPHVYILIDKDRLDRLDQFDGDDERDRDDVLKDDETGPANETPSQPHA